MRRKHAHLASVLEGSLLDACHFLIAKRPLSTYRSISLNCRLASFFLDIIAVETCVSSTSVWGYGVEAQFNSKESCLTEGAATIDTNIERQEVIWICWVQTPMRRLNLRVRSRYAIWEDDVAALFLNEATYYSDPSFFRMRPRLSMDVKINSLVVWESCLDNSVLVKFRMVPIGESLYARVELFQALIVSLPILRMPIAY